MKVHELIGDIETDIELDIYSQDADYFEEDDTLTSAEAGFMIGYMNA